VVQKPVTIRETGEGFDTIQAAIDAASEGQHIDVSAGTYNEIIRIEKMLYITGEERTTTIIDGSSGGFGKVVHFTSNASGSDIRGFTIRSNNTKDGIVSDVTTLTIGRNIIKENFDGILFASSGGISGVLIKNNDKWGLYLSGGASISITECTVQNNPTGMEIYVNPKIVKCEVKNNTGNGGIVCGGTANPDIGGGAQGSVGQNRIKGNANWDLSNRTTNAIKAEYNYWDHTTASAIDANDIYDDDEYASYGAVDFQPFFATSLASLRMKPRLLLISSLFNHFFRSLFRGDLPVSAIYLSPSFEPRLGFASEELRRGERHPLFVEPYYPPLRMRTKR